MAPSQITASRQPGTVDFLILILPPLFWAGNFVVGRAVSQGAIPPLTLSFGRWVVALACFLPFAYRPMMQDLGRYWQYRWRLLGISITGVAAFNTLVYIGLKSTTATNGILLNSFIPILIAIFGALFYGQRLRGGQIMGLVLSFAGVLTIVLHGDWSRLKTLDFSRGDLVIFAAMVSFAFYSLWLRDVPAEINRTGLLAMQMMLAVLMLFPLFLWEYGCGVRFSWTPATAGAFLYLGIFPSVLAYLFYNIGVAKVGAARAGLFIHLMPAFGALLAALFLGESLHLYHLIGISGIFMGIALSNRCSRT